MPAGTDKSVGTGIGTVGKAVAKNTAASSSNAPESKIKMPPKIGLWVVVFLALAGAGVFIMRGKSKR